MALLLSVVLAMFLAACGGGGDKSSTGDDTSAGAEATSAAGGQVTDSAEAPTGTPVKVMLIGPYDNPLLDWVSANHAAEAAEAAINGEGGIGGRPLDVLICNERLDPNKAAACARKAAGDKVAAVTTNSIFSSAIIPILEDAKIPTVGSLVTESIDFESPIAFPIYPGTNLINGAWPGVLAQEGKPKFGGVLPDLGTTETDRKVMETGAKASGADFAGLVSFQVGQTDYSGPVQQVKDLGAEASVSLMGQNEIVPFLKTSRELGLQTTWAMNGYSAFPSSFTTLGPAADGILTLDPLPPATATDEFEGVQRFNEELEAAGADEEDDRSLVAMQTWLALHAIAMVADKVPGEVDSSTMIAELEKGETMDLFDILEWTPAAKGPGEYERLANGELFLSTYEDGKLNFAEPVDGFQMFGLD